MPKNEVLTISQNRKSYAIRLVLTLLTVLFFSSLNSINSNKPLKYSRTNIKNKNKILSKIKKSQNKKNTSSVITEMTLEQIKETVQAHNYFRNKVAMGQTEIGSVLPPARNMLQVYWSPVLAKQAQEWAMNCKTSNTYSHSQGYKYKGKDVGECLFKSFIPKEHYNQIPQSFKDMVEAWYSEIRNFDEADVENFKRASGRKGVYGHFVQITWAMTYVIGCGYCQIERDGNTEDHLVCQYYNRGVILDLPYYLKKKGNQCECPQGYACKNPDYPGLCCPDNSNWCQKNSFLWFE